MKKAAVWSGVLFSAILIVIVLMFSCNNRKLPVAVLKDHNICFGDPPEAVASEMSGTCIEKEQLASSGQTVYTYKTVVLDMPAEVNCFFLDDKHLAEADIMIRGNGTGQAAALFEQAGEMIREAYKNEESFWCGDVVFCDENSYYLSLGVTNGATGIDYTIRVKDNVLYIICVDCR